MTEEAAATATETEAATATEETSTATAEETTATTTEEKLGPAGEKALEAFKGRAKTAEKEAKELRDRLDKIEEANKTEGEKALDKARKEARKEAETEFEKERRSDRLAVAVAGHARELADVDLTVLAIKQADIDELFDGDGKVDSEAFKSRLEELLKKTPSLRATGVGKPTGSADGGEGEGGGGSTFNDQIRAARK